MSAYLFLAASGFLAWIVSTIGGGGGAMLLVPLVGFVVGAQAVAPVVTLATLIAGGGRALLFRRDIEWSVVRWGLPGAAIGAIAGAALFSTAPVEWLQILVGLFLVSTLFQYWFDSRPRTGERQSGIATWWFFPLELVIGFLSGLIGAMGPVMNSFYLRAGITKARMVGTKTAISLPMQLLKMGTYTVLGSLTGELFLYGLAAGAGAFASGWLARSILRDMTEHSFRAIIVGFMVLSGLIMLWEQRATIVALYVNGLDLLYFTGI